MATDHLFVPGMPNTIGGVARCRFVYGSGTDSEMCLQREDQHPSESHPEDRKADMQVERDLSESHPEFVLGYGAALHDMLGMMQNQEARRLFEQSLKTPKPERNFVVVYDDGSTEQVTGRVPILTSHRAPIIFEVLVEEDDKGEKSSRLVRVKDALP